MSNLIQVGINYKHPETAGQGWHQRTVTLRDDTTLADLADMLHSQDGVCKYDPWFEHAVGEWTSTSDEKVHSRFTYHVAPTPDVVELLDHMTEGLYIDDHTF